MDGRNLMYLMQFGGFKTNLTENIQLSCNCRWEEMTLCLTLHKLKEW